jgi:HAE1 family hydrophobic/amphiphilic exporter-1
VHFVTRLSLRLGAVVFLAVVLLFGVGIFAATQVQQDLLPNISVPALIVITPDPGASPQIVDSQVTVPVVNAMEGIAGTDTVQSTSSQGASLVIVLFKDGTDLKSAQQDASSALAGIRSLLPPQASSSSVQTFSTNSLPILEYAISADEPLGDLAGQLQSVAVPKLRGLAGISSVVLSGAPTNEVDVTLDPTKLAARGVSITQVASALQQASVVESVGSLKQGSATIPLQVSGSLTSLDQIGKVTVTPPSNPAAGGRPPPPGGGDPRPPPYHPRGGGPPPRAGGDRPAGHGAGRLRAGRHDHANQRQAEHRPPDHRWPEQQHGDCRQ